MDNGENRELTYFKEYTRGIAEATKTYKVIIILTNLFWCIALCLFLWFAYFAPGDTVVSQEQDYSSGQQSQYYEEG